MRAKVGAELAKFTVLNKLLQIGAPMNMLEIGFSASPQVIRNMAARGMIRVTVELTPRGREALQAEQAKRKRQAVNEAKEQRIAAKVFG